MLHIRQRAMAPISMHKLQPHTYNMSQTARKQQQQQQQQQQNSMFSEFARMLNSNNYAQLRRLAINLTI